MSKLENLKKLREELDIKISGKENYPKDAPSVIITNDNSILNMTYLPMISDDNIVTLVSPSLETKNKMLIDRYINSFPMCDEYGDVCADYANRLLLYGISVNAYENDLAKKYVPKIIFSSLDYYNFVYLLPVEIEETNSNIEVKVKEPINPIKYYRRYVTEMDKEAPTRELIEEAFNKIEIPGKESKKKSSNVILFPSGTMIETKDANIEKNKDQYTDEIKQLSLRIINECGDIR